MSQTSSPTDPVKLLTKASTEPIEINTNQSSAGNDHVKNKTSPKDKKHVSPGANNNTKASPKPKLSPTTAAEVMNALYVLLHTLLCVQIKSH